MIKLIGIGIWACAVSLGASYAVLQWTAKSDDTAVSTEHEEKISEVRTKQINVPIIADGTVTGYVIAQFVFTIDNKILKTIPVKPEIYLLDEAFKTIYAGEKVNFKHLKKQDLPALAKQLGENVNKRLAAPLIHDVLIDQLSYVPREEARGPPPKKS
jgi:hypothetical protein